MAQHLTDSDLRNSGQHLPKIVRFWNNFMLRPRRRGLHVIADPAPLNIALLHLHQKKRIGNIFKSINIAIFVIR